MAIELTDDGTMDTVLRCIVPQLPDPAMLDTAERRDFFKRTAAGKFFMRAVGESHPCFPEAAALLEMLLLRNGKPNLETKRRYAVLHEHWRGYARTTQTDFQTTLPSAAGAVTEIEEDSPAERYLDAAFAHRRRKRDTAA